MNQLLITFALLLTVYVATSAAACPNVACTMEFRPGHNQHKAVMVYKGDVCEVCQEWVKKSPNLGVDGCPVIPCNRMAIPCAKQTYFVYNNKLCPTCQQSFC